MFSSSTGLMLVCVQYVSVLVLACVQYSMLVSSSIWSSAGLCSVVVEDGWTWLACVQ